MIVNVFGNDLDVLDSKAQEIADLLGRPANERAMLVMPVGYPATDAAVPDLRRKELGDISVWKES